MDPINPLSQLMLALRQQIADQAKKTRRTASPHTERHSGNSQKPVADSAHLEQIQMRIRDRIRQLEPNQRDSEQAAQIFVESILAWEFGEELLHDPHFHDMSQEVQASLTSDPEIWKRFQGLLRSL